MYNNTKILDFLIRAQKQEKIISSKDVFLSLSNNYSGNHCDSSCP